MSSTYDDPLDKLAFALLVNVVDITGEKWVAASRFTSIADTWNVQDLQARIILLTAVLRLLRGMPTRVFESLDHRQSILDAAQHALDAAIDAEENPE